MAREESALRFTPEQREAAMAVFAECSDLREFGCRVLEAAMNAMMDAEAQRECGAERGERSEGRANSRNGYRPRPLKASIGGLPLEAPKLRHGTCSPEGLPGRYARVEASMAALVQEMYVAGVSAGKVERVPAVLGVESLSSPEVSSLCGGLDAEVEAFRSRGLGGCGHPCVWLDATYMSAPAPAVDAVQWLKGGGVRVRPGLLRRGGRLLARGYVGSGSYRLGATRMTVPLAAPRVDHKA